MSFDIAWARTCNYLDRFLSFHFIVGEELLEYRVRFLFRACIMAGYVHVQYTLLPLQGTTLVESAPSQGDVLPELSDRRQGTSCLIASGALEGWENTFDDVEEVACHFAGVYASTPRSSSSHDVDDVRP